ncbi:hypothetical protein FDECE_1113 [Fusarium decemcellulare]|nr:hypothetical protein FDECE_1113 [Fusarium decemcellulare]
MRKSHKKSRLGCQTCKRRKIKCDETKPECGNCIRFGVCCDFSPIPSQPIRAATTGSGPGRRGRPRSDWASWAEQIRLSADNASSSGSENSLSNLNVADLELFHHYITTTANTLHSGEQSGLWCVGVPRLGFQYPYILALILSMSSYHMARQRPLDAVRYLQLAEQHSTTALQTATLLLSQLNPANSPALYITSVLICFLSFAKGPSQGNLLLIAEDGQVPWLYLLRGVRLVVSTTGWSSVFSGVLAEYYPKSDEKQEQQQPEDLIDPALTGPSDEDWRSSLNDIADLIDVFVEDRFKEAYKHELQVLTDCCEKTFGKGQNSSLTMAGKMDVVFVWIYQLGDVYVEGLRNKDPVPMIMLGHLCVLLRTIEGYWFIQGWASHMMNEILRYSERSRKWLAWPIAYLKGQSSLVPMSPT